MNFTYSEIYNFVYEKLRSAYNWTIQILTESVYANLISAFSYGVEQLAFYDEILTKESIFKTAELTSSINYAAWMLNYVPHRKIGSSSIAYVSADPSFNLRTGQYTYNDLTVTIPKWTPIVGPTINVYATEDVIVPTGTTVYHYNLPVNFTVNRPKIILLNDDGVAVIPVTVPVSDLGLYVNNPSTTILTASNNRIQIGSFINIKNSARYSGEYKVVSIPTEDQLLYPPSHHIAIQTNYLAQSTNSDLIEQIALGTILSAGQIRVPVREGIPLEYLYTATGSVNERIPIFSPNIDNDYYEVFIVSTQEVTINGVTSFTTTVLDTVTVLTKDAFLVNDLAKYYCTLYNDPEFRYIYFEFGDNIRTRKLVQGQKVLIKYAETIGDLGNTTSFDIINAFGENLVSSNGVPVTGLYVTNISSFIGGDTYETPDSIKFNSRVTFNESNLLISNWSPIVNKHPSILKSRVYTQVDIEPYSVNLQKQNTVYIAALNKSGKQILSGSVDANNIIYLYLRKYSSPTDVIVFQDTNIIQVRAIIYYKINPTNTVNFFNDVVQALKDKFDVYNVEYATSLYVSNVSRIVESASEELIYARVKLSYLENSSTNRYLFNDSPRIYLTATFRNNLPKDSFLNLTNGDLSIWIRRKLNGVYEKWIKIGKQIGSVLTFETTTVNSYNQSITVPLQYLNPNNTIEVGSVVCVYEVVNNNSYYKLATSDDEENTAITKFYYVQSYNQNNSNYTLIESGPVDVTGLSSINLVLNPNPFDVKDENNTVLQPNTTYFLNSQGKYTTTRGNGDRKFMLKVKTIPGQPNLNAVIPKGFYFDDCNIIASQFLYSESTESIKFYNYIDNFSIDSIKFEAIPHSNQVFINTQDGSVVEDISYTTTINVTRTTVASQQDILNPEPSQVRGYELRIIYNTIEKMPTENPIYTNDIRLPYFTNILDVQTDNVEFIED